MRLAWLSPGLYFDEQPLNQNKHAYAHGKIKQAWRTVIQKLTKKVP